MLEIPLTFWVCMAFFVFLKGLGKPKLWILLAVPIGAALLTKSLLGLLPIYVIIAVAAYKTEIRSSLTQPWIWIGIVGGILIGATWPIHEFNIFGIEALQEHYLKEIFSRSTRDIPLHKLFWGYPAILFSVFLPVVLLAVPGLIKIFRDRETSGTLILILLWALLPLILYSFSTARSSRYIFPILPALALSGAYWFSSQFPRASSFLNQVAVLFPLIALASLFWISPEILLKDENKLLKANHSILRKAVPELELVPYTGSRYWSVANPVMYYSERQLRPTEESIISTIAAARAGSGLLIADLERVSEVQRMAPSEIVFAERTWSLLRLKR